MLSDEIEVVFKIRKIKVSRAVQTYKVSQIEFTEREKNYYLSSYKVLG